MTPTFSNPYLTPPGSPPVPTRKLGLFIGEADYNYIKSLRLHHGTLTIAANILIRKLCEALAANGFNDFTTSDAFESAVANVSVRLADDCRDAAGGNNGHSPQERLPSGGASVCAEVPGTALEQRPVESPRRSPRRGRGTRAGEGGESKDV